MKRVAIFSGSFNPIHIGHLAVANYVCEYEEVDELWFVLSPQNPLKQGRQQLADSHRLAMIKHAIEGYAHFKCCDVELHLPRPSYTIRTLETLKEQYPDCRFVLLIGADNWDLIDCWKESQRIINEFGLIVYPRKGYGAGLSGKPHLPSVKVSRAPELEVSSTFVREAIRAGKDIRYFLPEKVYAYIQKNHCYEN